MSNSEDEEDASRPLLPAGTAAAAATTTTTTSSLRRRTRPNAVELNLLPITSGRRTDAEVRLFLQDRAAVVLQDRFDDPSLASQIAAEVDKVSGDITHVQIELDLNVERDTGAPLDRAEIPGRVTALVYRFDRFLRSLKHKEDADRQAVEQLRRAESQPVPTEADLQASEMPADMVEHLMSWGMEKHLEVVKQYVLGSEDALGVTVTFKDLTVTQRRPPSGLCGRRRDASPAASSTVELLKHLYGVIPAGRLTLLLGAPHSGKTQLLHALSRHTKNKGPITLSGDVYYNSHHFRSVHPTNFCTVVEQTDMHIPTLTVRETLEFAHRCRNRASAVSPEVAAKNKHVLKSRVDLVMAVLGLTRVADTVVGNENLKGISGGEMRRVTLGEMLVAGAKVLLLDEVSTGLDSAATFDITKSILAMCKVMNVSSVISLLQPPPETFDLFQDLILMANGHIVYHGERQGALGYMQALGRDMEREMDVADFLIETSLDRTAELVQAYRTTGRYVDAVSSTPESTVYVDPVTQRAASEREKFLVGAGKYAHGYGHLFKVVAGRQLSVLAKNRSFVLARLAQNIVMGLIIGALFFSFAFEQYYLCAMVLNQVLTMTALSTMALLGDVLAARNTYYKQSRESFFPPLVYVLADYAVGLPFSLMDAFLLGTISYFMAGLSTTDNGQPYFVFLVLFVSYSVCMATIVRFFGYVSPDQNVASSLGIFYSIVTIVFGGAVATPDIIPAWYIWIYWAFSPLAWAYRSLMQNEFLSNKYEAACDTGCPNTANGSCILYCVNPPCPEPFPQQSCGVFFLEARQVETDGMFLWLGAGIVWIYTALFIGFSTLALTFVRHDLRYAELDDDAFQPTKTAKGQHETPNAQVDAENQAATPPPPQHPQERKTSVELAQDPPTLVWRDLSYTIEVRAQDEKFGERRMLEVDLLKGISGFAKPYEMTALMGSSGAGKTTLLDCLCYRKTMGKIKGEIMVRGQQVVPSEFKKQVGYVEQFGIHNAKSTVRESLDFSAQLRLPMDTSQDLRSTIVDRVMLLLQIGPLAARFTDTLSFEENKRLTIAVELCAKARILFADEPTSGLTSKEANLTMSALDRIAKIGVPVICTIHQPSSEIFQKFTRLLLLKRGGEIVYFGKVRNLVAYFEAVPEVPRLPDGLNPATWMLDVIGAGVGRGSSAAQLDFAEVYRLSDQCQSNAEELESALAVAASPPGSPLAMMMPDADPRHKRRAVELEYVPAQYNQPYTTQFRLVFWRNMQELWRTASYSHLRWAMILFFGFLTGTLFLQQSLETAAGVQSRVSVINLMLLLTANHNAMVCIPFCYQRRALFYREHASGMFSGFIYALAYQLAEEPFILWEVAVSTVVFYFAVGMTATASAFFYYVFLLYFFTVSMTFLGATVAAGTGMQGAAMLITSLVVQLLVLFSGVAVPGNQLASWLLGGYYITPVRWAMEGLVVSQFTTYTDVICNPSSTVMTWTDDISSAPSGCAPGTVFHLSDVSKNACCSKTGNLPISAKAYTLTGWDYGNGTVTQSWLGPGIGGTGAGYQIGWLGYDYLYVVMTMIVVRIVHILLSTYLSFQMR